MYVVIMGVDDIGSESFSIAGFGVIVVLSGSVQPQGAVIDVE
jgi:hypothetical protein